FLALMVAGVAVWLWQSHAPPGSAAALLRRIGALSAEVPRPDVLGPLLHAEPWMLLSRHATTLALTAVLLASIGALESVLNFAAIEQQIDDRSDPDRELVAVGAANVVSGVFGGLP